jgi:hypothetical protein
LSEAQGCFKTGSCLVALKQARAAWAEAAYS